LHRAAGLQAIDGHAILIERGESPMAEATQSYATHRRFFPLFHFIAIPLLVINLIIRVIYAIRHWGARLVWWEVVVAVALLCVAFASRAMVLAVQDRLIRLEVLLRLQSCLPGDLRGRVGELSSGQLIGLRFCGDDAELANLTRSALNGELKGREDIKKSIKSWKPDTMRA
jgi:Family of unknown function (DUF6526)